MRCNTGPPRQNLGHNNGNANNIVDVKDLGSVVRGADPLEGMATSA